MNSLPHHRWKCDECEVIVADTELRVAPNPFNVEEEIIGCPRCAAVNSFVAACAIEDCKRPGTCGGPNSEGVYLRTCYEHADWVKK